MQWCPFQRPDAEGCKVVCRTGCSEARVGASAYFACCPSSACEAIAQARCRIGRVATGPLRVFRVFFLSGFGCALGCLPGDQVLPVAWKQISLPRHQGVVGRCLSLRRGGDCAYMAVTMRALRDWVRSWVPPELCGAVPDASIHTVHSAIFQDLFAAHRDKLMVGCKADILASVASTPPVRSLPLWCGGGWAPPGHSVVSLSTTRRTGSVAVGEGCLLPTRRAKHLQLTPRLPGLASFAERPDGCVVKDSET